MVASRQVLVGPQVGPSIHIDAPRSATLVICCLIVYHVYASGGWALGFTSAVLTAICIVPLFSSSTHGVRRTIQDDTAEEQNPSHIYTEADQQDIDMMRGEEHSMFGRMAHSLIEGWSQDIEELVYVAQVLRDTSGLLLLLLCGVSSMMMALVAGLDNMNVVRALILSITCYGVTTVLVARSARRIANQQVSQHGEPKLSSKEVTSIIDAIPEENFVPDDELENCDLQQIQHMLQCRKVVSVVPMNRKKMGLEQHCECADKDPDIQKQGLVDKLRQRRNYNDSCCICLLTFVMGDRIRVLPSDCHHEFHRGCFDKWAMTFAANNRLSNCNTKRGPPTCPLCNTSIEAKVCLSQ